MKKILEKDKWVFYEEVGELKDLLPLLEEFKNLPKPSGMSIITIDIKDERGIKRAVQ